MGNFQFESTMEFFAMGEHGVYVWTSYFITIAVIAALIQIPHRQKRQLSGQLRRRQRISSAPSRK
ncbi:MAG: heme exporter protein D [Cellvibrionaceae bacterium]|jgi:heme exporter protein D